MPAGVRPTVEEVRAMLDYDPLTGRFTWLVREGRPSFNTLYAGREAGYLWTPRGSRVTYRAIRLNDFPQLAHRLAWLLMTGAWPAVVVDHADGDGMNNAWANLRAADRSQNGYNAALSRRSSTGAKGVSRDKGGKFRAYISKDRRQVHLGRFDTLEAASAARLAAEREHCGAFGRARPC